MARTPSAKPAVEGWLQELVDGRLEIFLRTANYQGQPPRKIRASGSKDEMLELVEWFEAKTGLSVNHPTLPRVPKPMPGQTTFDMGSASGSTELSSDATLRT